MKKTKFGFAPGWELHEYEVGAPIAYYGSSTLEVDETHSLVLSPLGWEDPDGLFVIPLDVVKALLQAQERYSGK